MHHRFRVPCRFVQIKGVFSRLPVEGNEPLLVFAVFAALIPSIGRKIKKVPYMGSPQPGAFLDHFQHMFVIKRLIGFRIVAFFRLTALVLRIGVRPVLAEADGQFRVFPCG